MAMVWKESGFDSLKKNSVTVSGLMQVSKDATSDVNAKRPAKRSILLRGLPCTGATCFARALDDYPITTHYVSERSHHTPQAFP